MLSFVLRRLLQSVPTVLAVVLVIFVLFSVVPGSIMSSMSDDGRGPADPAVVERMKKQLGLDDPVYVRFGAYIAKLATGNLGTSFRTREPVTTMIAKRMWPTLQLIFAAMTFSIVIGVPLGFVAALRPGGIIDTLSMVVAVSGLSMAKFWLGLLLMYLFALKLGWMPSFGYGDGGLKYLILPAVTLGVSPMALLARTTRAAVLEIMTADFVRTARSKGMSETRVMKWHVMRNALVIILTTVGLQFGALMGQAVVVEKLYSWPGIGSLLVDSVLQRDIPAVQGSILVVVLSFLAINLLIDVLYGVIDPGSDTHEAPRQSHHRWRAVRACDPGRPARALAGAYRSCPGRQSAERGRASKLDLVVRHRRPRPRHLFPRRLWRAGFADGRHRLAAHQQRHRRGAGPERRLLGRLVGRCRQRPDQSHARDPLADLRAGHHGGAWSRPDQPSDRTRPDQLVLHMPDRSGLGAVAEEPGLCAGRDRARLRRSAHHDHAAAAQHARANRRHRRARRGRRGAPQGRVVFPRPRPPPAVSELGQHAVGCPRPDHDGTVALGVSRP